MTQTADSHRAAGHPAVTTPRQRGVTALPPVHVPRPRTSGPRTTRWHRFGPEAAVTLLALAVFGWRVHVPSPWRDEAVTLVLTSRPVNDLLELVTKVDLVHATYYLLVHALFPDDPGLAAIRLLSVLVSAVTALLLVRIGREMSSPMVGLAAGLMFVASPMATRYAQEARPYAMATCMVTASILALLRACRRPWVHGRWKVYGATVVVAALFHMLSLSMLAVHAVYVLSTTRGRIRRTWAATAGTACLLLVPFVLGATMQRGQVSWLVRPELSGLTGFFEAVHQPWEQVLGLLLLAVLLIPLGTHRTALGLGLAWAILPPAGIWLVSLVHPLFAWRYVVIAVPGLALALASVVPALVTLVQQRLDAVTRTRRLPRGLVTAETVRAVALVPLLILAVGGVHMQYVYRGNALGHAEDVRGAASYIQEWARPGDAVLFVPGDLRIISQTYPRQFRNAEDIALATTPERSATISGVDVEDPDELASLVADRSRIWVVSGPQGLKEHKWPSDPGKVEALAPYRMLSFKQVPPFQIRLYVWPHPTSR